MRSLKGVICELQSESNIQTLGDAVFKDAAK